MVQAAEDVTGRQLSESEITEFFRAYVQRFGKFYMHTDKHGLEHMLEPIQANSRFAGLNIQTVDDVAQLVTACPPEVQDDLLAILSNPNMIGCGHLKLLLTNKFGHNVRSEIVTTMINSYYHELWNNNQNLEFVVLEGNHTEGAVVLVEVGEGEIDGQSRVPTISPLTNGTSVFVDHPQAVGFLRTTIADQIASQPDLLPGITPENVAAYKAKVGELGNQYLAKTVDALARYSKKDEQGNDVEYTLPVYKLHFTSETEYTVELMAESKLIPKTEPAA
jgi:hypothetical protein